MDTKPWSGFRAWLYSLIFRSPKTNRLIVDLAELEPSDRVLDVGCGPGAAVRRAADIVVAGSATGVDRAQPMVDIARRRSGSHNWEDRLAGLAEMRRVLGGGGRAMILEQDGKKHGLTEAEADAVAADLTDAGFDSVEVARHDGQVVITARVGSTS